MEPLSAKVIVSLAVLALVVCANLGALFIAWRRYRATGDLPPTLPQRVEPSADGLRANESARLSELESNFQRIERAFNDLHSTVETRHRSLSGLVSKKLGRAVALPESDDDDDAPTPPKSAFEKLAELERSQLGGEQQHQQPPNGRRHLRRY